MRFPSVLGDFVDSYLADVRVALPGRVVAYDPTTQRADVQPDVKDGQFDEDEQRVAATPPVVNDVPVVFPGSGAWRVTFPIAVGDPVLLVFASSSIARWKSGSSGPVDPGDDRHHHLNDAIAIPGLVATPPTPAPIDRMVLHAAQLRLTGPNASQSALRGEAFLLAFNQFAIDLINALSTVSGDPGDGAALRTAVTNALQAFNDSANTYKSALVKLE